MAEGYILKLLGLESLKEIKIGDVREAIELMSLKLKGKLSSELTKRTKGRVAYIT